MWYKDGIILTLQKTAKTSRVGLGFAFPGLVDRHSTVSTHSATLQTGIESKFYSLKPTY